jgi:hypothetical protein
LGQSQIVEASHLIVFANEINFGTTGIDDYIKNASETRIQLKAYKVMLIL